MKTTLNDLRVHLFDTIERLQLTNDPNASDNEKISIETAKAIAEIGQVIVNSAKLEVEAMKIISRAENPKETLDAMKSTSVMLLGDGVKREPTTVNHVTDVGKMATCDHIADVGKMMEEPTPQKSVIESEPVKHDTLPDPVPVVEKSERIRKQDIKLAEYRLKHPIKRERPIIEGRF